MDNLYEREIIESNTFSLYLSTENLDDEYPSWGELIIGGYNPVYMQEDTEFITLDVVPN